MCTPMTRDQASDLAASLIEARIAGPADNVTIVGRNNLELLIALSRCGLRHATCRDTERAPHGGDPAADILVIPEIDSEIQVSTALSGLGHELRRGGAVVALAPPSVAAHMMLRRALVARGFVEIRALAVAGGRILLCARKPAASVARAA
jgi:hypothetical protein